jgi:hypothetical protein
MAAFTSRVIRRRLPAWKGEAGSVCSSREIPATPSMSAEMKTRKGSVGVAVDDVVLAPLLLPVQRAVLEVAHADGRGFVQRDLALGAVVDVAVEMVDTERTVPLLVELLEVRTANH